MFEIDQKLRIEGVTNAENLSDKKKKLNSKKESGIDLNNLTIYMLDAVHNYKISKIVEDYGYPTIRMLGKENLKKFFVLIQHQDFDLKLQEKCLKYCDFGPKEKAYLTDRILVNKGKKQIYGTQFKLNTKKEKLIPHPIKDMKYAKKKRIELGMSSIREDEKNINNRMNM